MNFEHELKEIVKQYEREGYAVYRHPSSLPAFAAGFEPDLLAVRGGESVLVQVKQSRADVEADAGLSIRAGAINSQEGWRYDLIVLEPYSILSKTARMAGEPTIEEINGMLKEPETMLLMVPLPEEVSAKSPGINEGILRAAFLQAWAALEATMRNVTHKDGGEMELQPTVLIRQLYSAGRISLPEYHLIETNRQMRNSIVHGFGPISVHPNQVESLVGVARKLISDRANGH